MGKTNRNTIFLENAEVLSHQAFEGGQYILRVRAEKCAQHAMPGSFAHIQCDPLLPMRRPISILRVSQKSGWVDFLYKLEGQGTRLLSTRKQGDKISILAPIGNPFVPHAKHPRPLLIGGGVGLPPMIFLADRLRKIEGACHPLVLMGSEVPFPFQARPSEIMVDGIEEDVIACMPLLDDWNIASRLTSLRGYAGCYQGYVTDLARQWLDHLDENQRREVEIFACGPHPMLEAVAALAREFGLPCQVSLEEFMACAVGGCAGCIVEVKTPNGPAMKRVCVDGPVFDAASVFQS
ncbi:MAG TPA: dihydroorotate dehydrogenase electron transfer subunit [Gammaproteobacteria bacterium]|nr:dihydroorotate dehydrogenase electron transfer subunit [Gammaproteobacteria bacterium]